MVENNKYRPLTVLALCPAANSHASTLNKKTLTWNRGLVHQVGIAKAPMSAEGHLMIPGRGMPCAAARVSFCCAWALLGQPEPALNRGH